MKRMLFGASVIVAIVLVAGGAYWYRANKTEAVPKPPSPSSKTQVSPSSSPALLEGGNAVNVKNQSTDGLLVKVDFAALDKPGFVVIHNSTKDNKPGEVIGHTDLLETGQHNNLEIDIDEDVTLKKGVTLFAMLHADGNGDKEYTSVDEDQPLKDDKDSIVVMKFTITSVSTGSNTDNSSEE